MASVLAPHVRLKAKGCASKPSKGPQWKGDVFISPEIYRAHFLSSPHTTWGHSTSPFFKFTVFIWYLCCMRAKSRHSSSGVWVSPKAREQQQQLQEHPSAFPFPHSFLCSPGGNCVTSIVEVVGREQKDMRWAGKGKSGDREAPVVKITPLRTVRQTSRLCAIFRCFQVVPLAPKEATWPERNQDRI